MCTEANLPRLLARARRIAIVHHWDADGIASAAMIIDWAAKRKIECRNATPPIGDYSCHESAVSSLGSGKPDVVLGLDLAVTEDALQRILGAAGPSKLVWVDHHSHPPPAVEGMFFLHPSTVPTADHPPSNAWFVAGLLSKPAGLLASIGTCGDLGTAIASHPIRAKVARIASKLALGLEELLSLTDLIDSNYRVGSRPDVEKAPWVLAQNRIDVEDLLNNQAWRANRLAVDRELDRLMSEGHERIGPAAVHTIRTKMHLASIVARQRALKEEGGARAVIVRNVQGRRVPFYVRRADAALDLTPLIALGQGMGYSAGGKPEVVGMVVPREEVDALTEKVIEYLRG